MDSNSICILDTCFFLNKDYMSLVFYYDKILVLKAILIELTSLAFNTKKYSHDVNNRARKALTDIFNDNHFCIVDDSENELLGDYAILRKSDKNTVVYSTDSALIRDLSRANVVVRRDSL